MINFFSILLVLFGTSIGAVGSLLFKKCANRHWKYLLTSGMLWGGIFLYGLSAIFYLIALRYEELSILYPLVSTAYIWTTFFSVKYLKEKMNLWKWLGVSGIILGVIFIGLGS